MARKAVHVIIKNPARRSCHFVSQNHVDHVCITDDKIVTALIAVRQWPYGLSVKRHGFSNVMDEIDVVIKNTEKANNTAGDQRIIMIRLFALSFILRKN
jgi:hypothetical protein